MITRNQEYGMHMREQRGQRNWLLNREPKPLTKNNAQTAKVLGFMRNRSRAASNKRASNAMNAMLQAYRNLVPIYGIGMNARLAARLVTMAELRAGRTIAKALNSNAVLKRAQNKRRARNFIGAELSMYRPRSGSLVRPSNVKARRIRSP
jgi:hypothetical protein